MFRMGSTFLCSQVIVFTSYEVQKLGILMSATLTLCDQLPCWL